MKRRAFPLLTAMLLTGAAAPLGSAATSDDVAATRALVDRFAGMCLRSYPEPGALSAAIRGAHLTKTRAVLSGDVQPGGRKQGWIAPLTPSGPDFTLLLGSGPIQVCAVTARLYPGPAMQFDFVRDVREFVASHHYGSLQARPDKIRTQGGSTAIYDWVAPAGNTIERFVASALPMPTGLYRVTLIRNIGL